MAMAGAVTARAQPASGAGRTMLPQTHAYQKELRDYLATLTETDFQVPEQLFTLAGGDLSDEDRYRAYILAATVPPIGGIRQPSAQFTLAGIEGAQAILRPPVYVDAMAWLAEWNDPGNPYYRSRAVKLRALVPAAVDMIMLDDAHERLMEGRRSDYLGGTLIWLAWAYRAAQDVLPDAPRAAFAEGLKKFVRRLDGWGPTGAMVDMDLFAAVSLRITAEQMNDPEITAIARAYVTRLFTDPRYFHPAGYFVDMGCFDTSYNGISLYFAAWAALQSPDWVFVRQATDQAFKLKSRLSFPDPDGNLYGPSQCSSRTSADSAHDQWNFPPRNLAAGMFSDHALYLTSLPVDAVLSEAPLKVVTELNRTIGWEDADGFKLAEAKPWRENHWIASGAVNYAYDHYIKGDYDRRVKLQTEQSPLLKPPFARGNTFIEAYGEAFLILRQPGYGLAIHTGPVGGGLHGWGGGQLCAFWTPDAGSVILGRRRGAQSPVPDSYEDWRIWPFHAVSGVTAGGNVFTSARLRDCQPVYAVNGQRAEVRVEGLIPREATNKGPCLQGEVRYERTFTADTSGLSIETRVTSDGKDTFAELYETIPVFLRDAREQSAQKPASIFFQTGKEWSEARAEPQAGVKAVKIERFDGAVVITFAKPARVRLSPEVWADRYQSGATCRTIMIDLMEDGLLEGTAVVAYRVEPGAP